MSNQAEIEIRRKIKAMEIGDKITLPVPQGMAQLIPRQIMRCARGWVLPVSLDEAPGSITVTRLAEWPKVLRYPELDALEVGGSHLYQLPPQMHQRVRQAASFINKGGKVRLACTVEGDHIRVTRLPMTDAEAQACPPIKLPERATRWGLDRLATEPSLVFEIEPRDHHKLRLACTSKAKATGWTIRCRIQDDGTMKVYRTDAGAPAAAPPPPAITQP